MSAIQMSTITSAATSNSAASAGANPAQKAQTNTAKDETAKAVQQVAAKIPAIKYMAYLPVKPYEYKMLVEEIYIPRDRLIYNIRRQAFYAPRARHCGSVCIRVDLDPTVADQIAVLAYWRDMFLFSKEEEEKLKQSDNQSELDKHVLITAKVAKKFLDSVAEMEKFDDVIFPESETNVFLKYD